MTLLVFLLESIGLTNRVEDVREVRPWFVQCPRKCWQEFNLTGACPHCWGGLFPSGALILRNLLIP